MESDAQIIKIVLNGDRQAFASLVRRYEHSVRAVCLSVLRDHHNAADAAQDAFIKAYEQLPALRKPASFGPWLMKISRRCAINLGRRASRDARIGSEIAVAMQDQDLRVDDQKLRLLSVLGKLPENERQVIMLRYFGPNTVRDVAGITGRSVGTVTKQLSRAQRRLRVILKEAEL